MKSLALALFFCSIITFLSAQIETEFLFDFQTLNNEEIADIQLFDFTNNGIEEICISTSNDSTWAIYVYDTSGELLDTFTYDLSAIDFLPVESHFIKYNSITYIVLLSYSIPWMSQIRLDIYDIENQLLKKSILQKKMSSS